MQNTVDVDVIRKDTITAKMNGLPGIEALFRENRRLATKLTKEEMKALRTYLDERLIQEHNDLYFELNNMKTNYDVKKQEMEDRVATLQRELEFQTKIADQYKSSDTNLANIHKKREERLEEKQNLLLTDLERNQEETKDLKEAIAFLKDQLFQKEKLIEYQNKQLISLENIALKVRQAEELIAKNEHLKQDTIKAKLEVDNREKSLTKLRQDMHALASENQALRGKLQETEQRLQQLQDEMKKQSKELVAKHENLAIAKYHLDLEKTKCHELENELQKYKDAVPTERQNGHHFTDASRMRSEILQIHYKHLEERVKLLEEKVAMYRNQYRHLCKEITDVSSGIYKAEQLKKGLVVHETTQMEKLLLEIYENMQCRKAALERSQADLSCHIPAIISKDASNVKTDALAIKRQAEISNVNGISVKSARLIQRIEVCEKAKLQFSTTGTMPLQDLKNKVKNNRNSRLDYDASDVKENHIPNGDDNVKRSVDTADKLFTKVKNKPPSIPALSRPKQINGPTPTTTWRRKQSVSMEYGQCISPTLIDLSLSPGSSPSPREKSKTFFSSVSSPLPYGIRGDRKSMSEPNFKTEF